MKDDFQNTTNAAFIKDANTYKKEIVSELTEVFEKELSTIKNDLKTPEEFKSRKAAREYLGGVSQTAVDSYVKEGLFNRYRIQGRTLYKTSELRAAIQIVQ